MSRFNLRRPASAAAAEEAPNEAPQPAAAPAVVEPVVAPAPPSPVAVAARTEALDVKLRLHTRLIEELDLAKLDKLDKDEVRTQVRRLVADFVRAEKLAFNTAELEAAQSEQ